MKQSKLASILEGVRIVDLTRNIAGPVSTMLAAEMGADVIKVEPPGGDEMRTWPPFIDGESAYFVSCNRGKRSIALDFKQEADREILRDLVRHADVVVENYRPGTLEKLGIGWNDFKVLKPRLVWVSVTGYGRTGPGAGAPAYDSMIQAFVGMMGITGEPQGKPARAGGSPIDISTAYLAWGSIMTGLFAVQKTGEGMLLEVSLMESALGFMHSYLQAALLDLPVPGRLGSETMGMYPMGAFETLEAEHCLVQVSNELQWHRFCDLLGAKELYADPRFATNPQRVKNRDELRPLLQEYLRRKTAPQWEEQLLAAGVPASHVKSVQKVASDPQIAARNMLKTTLLPNGREIPTWGVPVKADEIMSSRLLSVPAKDQHRTEILDELKRL